MKKTYMKPVMALQTITLNNVIAASPFKFENNNETGQGGVNNENASGAALGNSNYSIWSDDEE